MKIGDTVVPSKESVERSWNNLPEGRRYLVCRELNTDNFMVKDLENGNYYSGYSDEFVVVEP